MDSKLPLTPTLSVPLGSGIQAVGAVSSRSSTPSFDSDLPRSRKRRFNWRILAAIAAVAVLVIGGIAGFVLTQQSQDLRQQASGQTCSISVLADSSRCVGLSVGATYDENGVRYECRRDTNAADGTAVCSRFMVEIYCAGCSRWFPASGGGCNTQCQPSPGGGNDNDPSPGQPVTSSCGGNGEACCDPSNRAVCNGSLYCNTQNWKCQVDVPAGICGGDQGSGGQLDPNKCIVCDCGSQCNKTGECTLNCRADQDCNAATQALLSGNTCGQVDFQDTNKAYCGVKAIKCDGSCAGGGGGGGGGPAPVQCREIIGRIGEPGNLTASEVAPRIGDQFFLRCRRIAGATSFRFRYYYTNKNDLASLAGSAVRIGSHVEGSGSSVPIPIDKVGLYYGQCRVCIADASSPSGQRCSAWESRTGAKRLPYQEGGPFGTMADPTDAAVPDLAPSTVDADNDAPRGTIPVLMPITEYDASQPDGGTTDSPSVEQPVTQ